MAAHPRLASLLRRRGAGFVVVALTALLAGCSVHATLTVTVRDDGSGTVAAHVALDPEAVQTAEAGGQKLEQAVRLTDLRAGGWRVGPWARRKDGSASITLTKSFQHPGQVAGIARELSGAGGPLSGLRASVDRAWVGLARTASLHAVVDLRGLQSGVTSDAALRASLAGHGVNVAAIDEQLTAQLRSGVTVSVVANLPGASQRRTARPGTRVAVDASATRLDPRRVLLVAAAIVLLVLAALAWWLGRRRTTRARRGRPPTARVG